MKIVNTEKPGLVRDIDTKAILFSDNSSREEYRARISEKMKMQAEINNLKASVESIQTDLKNQISELKEIILSAIKEKGNI